MREDFVRRSKVREKLLSININPYPHIFRPMYTVNQIVRQVQKNGVIDGEISTAGRIYALRPHGKTTFLDVKDNACRLQCQLRVDVLGHDRYDHFKRYIEKGDIIGVSGTLFYTRRGELTLQIKNFTILCKVLYDIPRTWFGLRNVETRYRQRYFDLLLNENIRNIFIMRSEILSATRDFFDQEGFLEVETPIIQPSYGGASARPFMTHINTIDEMWYLQISPELYLKRLIIGGLNRVYTICKNFRNESIDVQHNPEFTMLEAYQSYADYTDMLKLTENLIVELALETSSSLKIKCGINEIDLTPPWQIFTMYEAIKKFCGFDVKQMSNEEIQAILQRINLPIPGGYNRGLAIAQIFEYYCEEHLIQPTFIVDYPKETVPLCKIHRDDPNLIERFELYINRMELANAYSELNDPILQENLFEEELARRNLGDEKAHPYDEDFLEALRFGMPPTGGLGIGVDRLVMILTGNTSIKEVILFPMMKSVNTRAGS